MKNFKIGDSVVVAPVCGPMGGHRFTATIIDKVGDEYVVEDQDSEDIFTVEENELERAPAG